MATLPKVGDYSIYPTAKCRSCGKDLWEERSVRSGGKLWYVTKDGRHHPKKSCPFSGDSR